ncbi:MAG: thrombospondin type 3 repeat-containing protein [Prosthecobacter sp.]
MSHSSKLSLRLCLLVSTFGFLNLSFSLAQTITAPNEGLQLTPTAPSSRTMSWFGQSGRTYFVQTSATLRADSWTYIPFIELGTGAVIQWGFQTGEPSLFLRLQHTNQSFTGAAGDADFDGDGLTNTQELLWTLTDPLDVDSNDNGINDKNEIADSDGDGVNDAEERAQGTNPFDAASSVFALTGLRLSTPLEN